MANAAASKPNPLEYQTQRAIVLQAADRDVIKILKDLQADVRAQLRALELSNKPGVGRMIRESQLRLVQRNLQVELAKAWRRVGDVTEARRVEAAIRSANYAKEENTFRLVTGGVADGGLIADHIFESEAANAASGLDRMIARTSGASYVPLSDRVYNSSVHIGGQLDRIVNSAIARGLSAVEFAREVRQFVNPLTPGGVRYAAMRLARTEINNAAHAMAVHAVRDTPWIDKMQWHLSGSHGRPDVCDQLAKGGPNNNGAYPKGAVPSKPHPQCLCFVTPVSADDEEFESNLLAGRYNQYLEKYRNLQPGQVVSTSFGGFAPKAPTPRPVRPTKTATPEKPGAKPPTQSAPKPPGAPTPATFQQEHIDFAKVQTRYGVDAETTAKNLMQRFGVSREHADEIVKHARADTPGIAVAPRPAPVPPPKPSPASLQVRANEMASQGFGQGQIVKQLTAEGATGSDALKAALDAGKSLAVRTVPPGVSAAPVARVTQSSEALLKAKVNLRGLEKARIEDELLRQAKLVPRTANRLNGVDYMDAGTAARIGAPSDALGVYLPREQRIYLNQTIFKSRYADSVYRREVRANWCSHADGHVRGDQATFGHEFGHHVGEQIAKLPLQTRTAFWKGIANDLGVPPPIDGSPGFLKSWMSKNKSQLQSLVSEYGTTNEHELLAEIWHEYTQASGANRRAWIGKAGDRMRDLAETS